MKEEQVKIITNVIIKKFTMLFLVPNWQNIIALRISICS